MRDRPGSRGPGADGSDGRARGRVAASLLLALLPAAAAGFVLGHWTPRGPVTSAQALTTMVVALAVGAVAGAALRSRWALLLSPAALLTAFELTRLGSVGPTVDAPRLGDFLGIGALAVGRLPFLLLVLLPLAVGVLVARPWALRRAGQPAHPPRVRRAFGRLGTTGAAALALLLAVALLRPGTTEPIRGADGEPLAGSIAELSTVEIGGHEQTVLIRGSSTDNPVLLFLAGGPGGFEIGTMSRRAGPLERDFVLVTWEQRGTGTSYGSLEPAQSLTFDGAVTDTITLSEHLRERFDEQRIYLLGNSYGTLLAAVAAQQRPDLYAALIGSGQMVSIRETDQMFYEDTIAWAQRNGDDALVAQLREWGPPPYRDLARYLPLVSGEHRWNDWSQVHGAQGRNEPLDHLAVPEYTLLDRVRSLSGLVDTYAQLYPQLQQLDLRRDVPRLDVPVHLVQGRYEARGRAVPAQQWFELLQAPRKSLVVLEGSGHRPFAQEPEALSQVLRSSVLPSTRAGWVPAAEPVVGPVAGEEPDELLELFSRYNPDVWPAAVAAHILLLLGLALVLRRPGPRTDRAVSLLLAAVWLWLGVVFHGLYAAPLAPLTEALYGALFVLQAGLLLRAGVVRRTLVFTRGEGISGRLGWASLGYALVAYPLIGLALGHSYPEAPLLGVAPCPSTIATFGLLLLVRPPLPRHLLAVPLLWAVLAPLAAVGRGLYEDVGLLVVGVLATVVVLVRDRRSGAGHRPAGSSRAAARATTGSPERLVEGSPRCPDHAVPASRVPPRPRVTGRSNP
jgi:proline iminopeptidase